MNTRVILAIQRGVIQRLKCNQPGVQVEVIDLDAIDSEPPNSPERDRAEILLGGDYPWDATTGGDHE